MQHDILLPQFRDAVATRDTARLRSLLADHPELVAHLDDLIFGFDAPAVVAAAHHGARDVLDVLLDAGADIDRKSGWGAGGFGVLHQTCFDHPEVAAHLVSRGATIDIWAAAGLGRDDLVQSLLADDAQLVHAKGPDGQTPLHFAKTIPIADMLLDAGADIDALCVDHESTPAQWQVTRAPDVARHLLRLGARPDVFVASALGEVSALKAALVANPASVGVRLGSDGNDDVRPGNIMCWMLGWHLDLMYPYPHHVASHFGHRDALATLNAASDDYLRFIVACTAGDRAEALALAPTVGGPRPEHHRLLADAAWGRQTDAVEVMLAVGFDPHVPGDHGSTPLDRAAFHGFDDVVSLLLAHDPSPPLERANEFGGPPLETLVYASREGWRQDGDLPATARLLLQAGAQATPRLAERAREDVRDAILVFTGEGHPLSRGHDADDALGPESTCLRVSHNPNPAPLSVADDESEDAAPAPFVWRFSTMVTNCGSVPLTVDWFDSFALAGRRWIPWNALLDGAGFGTAEAFEALFAHSARLEPGEQATFASNWRGYWEAGSPPLKWAIRAIEDNATEHIATAIATFEG